MMARKPVIAVVGTGQEIEPAVSNARKLGQLIAEQRWVLITGGRNAGVMRAANEGAKKIDGSLTIGILPDRETQVSRDVDVAIVTDAGEARNNIIVLSASILIACGADDPGTVSEVSLAVKAGKPIVLLGASEPTRQFFRQLGTDQIRLADSPDEAVATAKEIVLLRG
jgi:uncharacterized protein (TIGR00725 family)